MKQIYEDARKMYRTKIPVKKLGVRRMDRQGEVLFWCRKCSGHSRQRMGPTLMDGCKLEQLGTKEHGKMLKRIQIRRRQGSNKRG